MDKNKEKYREYIMKKAALVKIILFLVFVCIGAVISFILPLRPTESEYEKRTLTKFPAFSVSDFLDGTYFENVDLWFADTFPFRDQLMICSEAVDNAYGIRKNVVHGEVVVGDEIPDVDIDTNTLLSQAYAGDDQSEDGEIEDGQNANDGGNQMQFNQMNISAEDVGTVVEDTDGTKAAQAGETLGSIFVVGKSAYSYYAFSQSTSDDYVNMINGMADTLTGKATVYDMLVPTSIDITLDDATRNSITSSNQQKAMLYMYSRMSSKVGKTYIYDVLKEHRSEYIYFRTDHHWTADGAYYAYSTLMTQMGKTPASLSQFEKIEFTGFKGSLFTQSGISSLGDNPDTIYAYRPLSTNYLRMINRTYDWTDYNIITDVNGWGETSKYSTFIGGDNPFTIVNNPNITDGSSIVIVKESYGNAMVPFFAESFENVYVVDYRYYKGTISDVVNQYGANTVVYVNNVAATSTQDRVDEMKLISK